MADPHIKQTVRIQLPVREPVGKAPLHTPTDTDAGAGSENLASSQLSRPVIGPSFSPPLSSSVIPAPESPSSGPKKETARILAMPHVAPQNSLIVAAVAREKSATLLSWILLIVSALILIIQIWTYFS
jgi:hypothetical protein